MELLNIELPKHPIGTKFTYRYGKQSYDAEVIGYHIEHDTTLVTPMYSTERNTILLAYRL
jgi:hypothetical protein